MNFTARLLALALAFPALSAPAAELVQVPQGILVRSLTDWEGSTRLEIRTGGREMTVPAASGAAEHLFTPLELCQDAAYRVDSGPWHEVSGYCQTKSDAMSFLFISDSQQYHDEHRRTGKLIAKLKRMHPELKFVLNGGDIVHFGLESEWKKYRAIATEEYSADLPVVPVIGNHEFYLDFTLANFKRVYGTQATAKGYYTLDYPLFSLIVLDSNVAMMTARDRRRQDAWLESQLKALSGAKPILVAFHHAAFTSGKTQHMLPIPPRHVRKHWQPLFEKYHVKLVLNGHEHIYERLAVRGVEYLLAGPAGGVLSTPGDTSQFSQLLQPSFRSVSTVTVESNGRLTARTWSVEDGTLVDEYSF